MSETPTVGMTAHYLDPDEVRAVLDSMESNDHCTRAYNSEISAVRGRIEALAGDGGLFLRRADHQTAEPEAVGAEDVD